MEKHSIWGKSIVVSLNAESEQKNFGRSFQVQRLAVASGK